jgi:hypothetical protein
MISKAASEQIAVERYIFLIGLARFHSPSKAAEAREAQLLLQLAGSSHQYQTRFRFTS